MRASLPIKNEKGLSLLLTVIVAGVAMMGLTATVMAFNSQSQKSNSQAKVVLSADIIRNKLVAAVLSPRAWQQTQSHNASVFLDGGDLSDRPLLDIYVEGLNTPYYSSKDQKAGFNLQGHPCPSGVDFDSVAGNALCPFRYEVRLISRVFQNNNWIETLRFDLRFKPGPLMAVLNPENERYSFDLIRNIDAESAVASCVSVSGNFLADQSACSVQLTQEVTCPTSTSYKGAAGGDKQQHCETVAVAATQCAGLEVVKGFDSNGNALCGAPL